MRCLDDKQLKQYMRGTLPVAEMLAAGDHIPGCSVCKARLARLSDYVIGSYSTLFSTLDIGECPEYEELSGYVEETLSHEAHQSVERHIASCELCWRDVETLHATRSKASFAPQITVQPGYFAPRRKWSSVFGWQRVAAVSSGVAAVALAIVLINSSPVKDTPVAVQPVTPVVRTVDNPTDKKLVEVQTAKATEKSVQQTAKTVHTTTEKSVSPVPASVNTKAPKQEFAAELRDGGVTVGHVGRNVVIRSDGKDLEAQVAALVREKLKSGQVPASFRMAKADELRGPIHSIEIAKSSPVSDGVTDSSPFFSWETVEGATKYRVEVYNLDGTCVMSAETDTTSYQADQALTPGWYKWTVRPRRGISADWEWSKASSFRVLSAKEAVLLDSAKREGSHLVLGTVYESLGLSKQAVSEFEALAAENPESKLAKRLLAGAEDQLSR